MLTGASRGSLSPSTGNLPPASALLTARLVLESYLLALQLTIPPPDDALGIWYSCGALSNIETHFHYTKDGPHTAAAAMAGTCDVECDSVYASSLATALQDGLVNESTVQQAAWRIYSHRMHLGMFDKLVGRCSVLICALTMPDPKLPRAFLPR